MKLVVVTCTRVNTAKPPIVDPLRKGHNINDLSTRDTARGPKRLPSLFSYTDNLREEDNLSTKDKTNKFILSPTCPLFRGFTVPVTYACTQLY